VINRRGFLKSLVVGAASLAVLPKIGFEKVKKFVYPIQIDPTFDFRDLRPGVKYRVSGSFREEGKEWTHFEQTLTVPSMDISVPPHHYNCRCAIVFDHNTKEFVEVDHGCPCKSPQLDDDATVKIVCRFS
jgi:hypothetical protein